MAKGTYRIEVFATHTWRIRPDNELTLYAVILYLSRLRIPVTVRSTSYGIKFIEMYEVPGALVHMLDEAGKGYEFRASHRKSNNHIFAPFKRKKQPRSSLWNHVDVINPEINKERARRREARASNGGRTPFRRTD